MEYSDTPRLERHVAAIINTNSMKAGRHQFLAARDAIVLCIILSCPQNESNHACRLILDQRRSVGELNFGWYAGLSTVMTVEATPTISRFVVVFCFLFSLGRKNTRKFKFDAKIEHKPDVVANGHNAVARKRLVHDKNLVSFENFYPIALPSLFTFFFPERRATLEAIRSSSNALSPCSTATTAAIVIPALVP